MAKLRIFVSSTCYDLGVIRSELRPFISAMGYEPVMSDYSDILYDPRSHTHDSCIKEVPNCDMVLLIIGQRFGGTAIPSVIEGFNLDILKASTTRSDLLYYKEKLSITQLEVLKAVEQSIPLYAFVDDKVLHDHHVYEKNKDKKEIIDAIEFPSIYKKETAKYIFEFINFLTHRVKNNSITSFIRLEDIKGALISQWSQLFQRLLSENRNRAVESRRYMDFSERIEDLKAIVLASIATPNLRDTARGAIQYRHLVLFISSLNVPDHKLLLTSDMSWDDVLKHAGIVDIRENDTENGFRSDIFMILQDGTFYRCRYPRRFIEDIKIDWNNFVKLDKSNREAISDALLEDKETRRHPAVRYVPKNFEDYIAEKNNPQEIITESLS